MGVKEIGTRLPGIRPGSFKCYYRVTGALESEQRRDELYYTEGTECFSLTPGGPLVCMAVSEGTVLSSRQLKRVPYSIYVLYLG